MGAAPGWSWEQPGGPWMLLEEQQAQHTAGQMCLGHPVLLHAWPKSLPSKIPLLGTAEAHPQSSLPPSRSSFPD